MAHYFFQHAHRLWHHEQDHQVTVDAVSKDEKDRIVIDPQKIDPLLRLGAGKYGTLGSVIPTPLT